MAPNAIGKGVYATLMLYTLVLEEALLRNLNYHVPHTTSVHTCPFSQVASVFFAYESLVMHSKQVDRQARPDQLAGFCRHAKGRKKHQIVSVMLIHTPPLPYILTLFLQVTLSPL
jgi:hypothetical protein